MSNLQINELSERELDILKLVATGASNKEIAQKLFISSNTVKVHLRNIFSKINATSRTEAAMYAVRIGLVDNAARSIPRQDDAQAADVGLPGGDVSILPVETPKPAPKIRMLQVIGGIILIIGMIIALTLYLSRSILAANTPVPPTPTQRIQWFDLAGLLTPRQGMAVIGYENFIYAIGGEDNLDVSNIVERYDIQTDTWTYKAPKTVAVSDAKAALVGGLIYVPGGRISTGEPTDITEVYDPVLDRWTTGIPLPRPLSDYSVAVYEGRIYVFGGWDGKNVTNSVYIFDPHDDRWIEAIPMPTPRSSAGMAVIGNKIYIVGGSDGQQGITNCEIYRPDLNGTGQEWSSIPSLPFGRVGMGVTELAGMILVIGGTNTIEDPATIVLLPGANEWSELDSPVDSSWTRMSTVVIGSRLYVMGGNINGELVTSMRAYQAIYTITLPIIR